MLNQIVVAVGAYRSEYGEWPPLQKSAPSDIRPTSDDWIGDPEMGAWLHNNAIFSTLRGIPEGPNENHAANPRKIVFLVGQQARFADDGGPVGGFFDSDSTGKSAPSEVKGCLYDPWGREYGIIFDSDGDERIDLGVVYVGVPRRGVDPNSPWKEIGALSVGKDRTLGTQGDRVLELGGRRSDDVVSWE